MCEGRVLKAVKAYWQKEGNPELENLNLFKGEPCEHCGTPKQKLGRFPGGVLWACLNGGCEAYGEIDCVY